MLSIQQPDVLQDWIKFNCILIQQDIIERDIHPVIGRISLAAQVQKAHLSSLIRCAQNQITPQDMVPWTSTTSSQTSSIIFMEQTKNLTMTQVTNILKIQNPIVTMKIPSLSTRSMQLLTNALKQKLTKSYQTNSNYSNRKDYVSSARKDTTLLENVPCKSISMANQSTRSDRQDDNLDKMERPEITRSNSSTELTTLTRMTQMMTHLDTTQMTDAQVFAEETRCHS